MYTFLLNEDVRYFERLAGNDTFISFQIVGTATRESIPDVSNVFGKPYNKHKFNSTNSHITKAIVQVTQRIIANCKWNTGQW